MCTNCDTCKFSYSSHYSNYNCLSLVSDRKEIQDWKDKNLILVFSKRSLTESTDLYKLVDGATDCPGWQDKNSDDPYGFKKAIKDLHKPEIQKELSDNLKKSREEAEDRAEKRKLTFEQLMKPFTI